jgi:predicted HAD superfamily Cof-like phosphohydrolase
VDGADAMIDLIYFALGTLVEMGIMPQNLMDIVHEANMGKLHNIDGKMVPVYREDGKTKKPDNWEADFAPEPKLAAEVHRQSKSGLLLAEAA